MADTVPVNYGIKFKDDFMMTLQKKASVLENAVLDEPDQLQGKYIYYDYVGSTTDNEVTEKYGDSPNNDVPHTRRRAFCRTFNWGRLVDPIDLRKLMKDPSNKYVQAARAAYSRRLELTSVTAMFADVDTVDENEAVTPVAFPAGQQVAVNFQYGGGGANAGLTLQKIVKAGELLDAGEVPQDDRFMMVAPRTFADLLLLPEVKSKDFTVGQNENGVLITRKIVQYAGFNILQVSTGLPVDGNGYRRVPCWWKGAVGRGTSGDPNVKGGLRSDKRYIPYLFAEYNLAALRLHEGGVVEIKCAEA